MSLKQNRNFGGPIGNSGIPRFTNTTKRVVDIILSTSHPSYSSPEDIGTIFYIDVGFNQETVDPSTLPTAKPLNRNNFQYPVIGELVQIVETTSSDVYESLGGNISNTTAYYTPAINIHNNTTSNALPLEKNSKKDKPKRESSKVGSFEIKKEFRNKNRQRLESKLDEYLRGLGFTSGKSDSKAPKYKMTQAANGDYIYRLLDTEDNEQVSTSLGTYYKENPVLVPLNPGEGDSIFEGKNGQRIRQTTTGPTGTNAVSNNVTEDPSDGNPTIGDAAMILSIGKGAQEDINNDPASVYILEHQGVAIEAACVNIDSLKSEYTPVTPTFDEISKQPEVNLPNPLEAADLSIGDLSFNFSSGSEVVNDPTNSAPIQSPEPDSDPVFAALDEAQDEGLLDFPEENTDISGTEDPGTDGSETDGQSDGSEFEFDFDPEADPDLQKIWDDYDPKVAMETAKTAYPTTAARRSDYKDICEAGRKAWEKGDYKNAFFSNQFGKLFVLPPPDPGTFKLVPAKEKTVEYLVIHVTAGHRTGKNPAGQLESFFTSKKATQGGATWNRGVSEGLDTPIYWPVGGYHWMITENGKATRVFPDDIETWGATGANSNGVHLNLIGGFNKTHGYTSVSELAEKYDLSEEECYRRLYGYKDSSLEGLYEEGSGWWNGNLATINQYFTLLRLIKKYTILYPGIKVVGHNQGASKPCPLFDVPYFCELTQLDTSYDTTFRFNGSGHPHRTWLQENSEYIAASLGFNIDPSV